jgi:GAF domain-containing protein
LVETGQAGNGKTAETVSMADDQFPSTEIDPTSELNANISLTVQTLFSAGSVQNTLAHLVELAVTTIEGCDFAGIFVDDGNVVTTPVCTNPVVIEADALQHRSGEGPCLDAMTQGATFYAGDLREDPRWPNFGPAAIGKGIRSLLAVPLLINGVPGALNLYARYPNAFGVIDRARGLLLAAMGGLAFSSAQSHEDEERRATNLHAALASREVIGQAQGILMERERITSDQAFDILRQASQHLNLKLRDIAQNLVDTGERPDTG